MDKKMTQPRDLSPSSLVSLLKEKNSFAVVSHVDPDPDAIGSSVAMYKMLQTLSKSAQLFNQSASPGNLEFLKSVKELSHDPQAVLESEVVFILDCGDKKRVGDALCELLRSYEGVLVNIDHHISNDSFGDLNLVDAGASSTAEIVYRLLSDQSMSAMGFQFDKEIATAILTGISGDTGGFRYSSTDADVFAIASELVKYGADISEISYHLYGRKRPEGVRLCSKCLYEMRVFASGKGTLVRITAEDFKKYNATREDVEELVESARDVDGVIVSVLLREDGPKAKVSLRSRDDRINVSEIASRFGGGGHVRAAGFRSAKDLAVLEEELVELLEKELEHL